MFCFSAVFKSSEVGKEEHLPQGPGSVAAAAGKIVLTQGVLHKRVFSGFRYFVGKRWEAQCQVTARLLVFLCFVLFCFVFKWKRNADLRPSSLFFLFSFLTMTNSC